MTWLATCSRRRAVARQPGFQVEAADEAGAREALRRCLDGLYPVVYFWSPVDAARQQLRRVDLRQRPARQLAAAEVS